MIREEVIALLFHAQLEPAPELVEPNGAAAGIGALPAQNGGTGQLSYEHQTLAGADAIAAAGGSTTTATAGGGGGSVATRPVVKTDEQSVGRNDPCWCGSGKKFKRCHGA